MALQDWIDESNDAVFRAKVDFYCVDAALDIIGEAIGGMTAAQHARRVALARQVVQGGIPAGFYTAVANNTTIQGHIDAATSYDSSLATAIAGVWDDLAGYDAVIDQ